MGLIRSTLYKACNSVLYWQKLHVNKRKHFFVNTVCCVLHGVCVDLYSCKHFTEGAMEVDEEAVYAAFRSRQSCNPVLRAQSRATLIYYRG